MPSSTKRKRVFIDRHESSLRWSLFVVSTFPALYVFGGLYLSFYGLGANPFIRVMTVTGHGAVLFLFLSLIVGLLRVWLPFFFTRYIPIPWGKRMSDWNIFIRIRRMLGLYCFFYASLHAWFYLDLELSLIWEEFWWELKSRRFLPVGVIAWGMLLALAATSTRFAQRKMRRWWRRLHRLNYGVAVLVPLHYLLAVKPTERLPHVYLGVFCLLLMVRFLTSRMKSMSKPSQDVEAVRQGPAARKSRG